MVARLTFMVTGADGRLRDHGGSLSLSRSECWASCGETAGRVWAGESRESEPDSRNSQKFLAPGQSEIPGYRVRGYRYRVPRVPGRYNRSRYRRMSQKHKCHKTISISIKRMSTLCRHPTRTMYSLIQSVTSSVILQYRDCYSASRTAGW
eukprot:3391255-Rhodomonas_salina.1